MSASPIEQMYQSAIDVNDAYVLWRMKPTDSTKDIFGASLWVYCAKLLNKDFHLTFSPGLRVTKTLTHNGANMYLSNEDLIQDAVLQIWDKLDQFNGSSSFATWARKAINTKTLGTLQRTSKEFDEEIVESGHDHDSYVSLNKYLDLRAFRETLSVVDDEFLQLKLDGYTEAELGAHFNENAEWAKVAYKRIVRNLQQFARK